VEDAGQASGAVPPGPSRWSRFERSSSSAALAGTTQDQLRRLLDSLAVTTGWPIRAWKLRAGFDHQSRPRSWAGLPRGRSLTGEAVLGWASLGCKLHCLPRGARLPRFGGMCLTISPETTGFIPAADLAHAWGVRTSSAPHHRNPPAAGGSWHYRPAAHCCAFGNDAVDRARLIGRPCAARERSPGRSPGTPPAPAGLRQTCLGAWADDPARQRQNRPAGRSLAGIGGARTHSQVSVLVDSSGRTGSI